MSPTCPLSTDSGAEVAGRASVVVGGSGAVGQLLADHLRGGGDTVVVVDSRPPVRPSTDRIVIGDILAPTPEMTAALTAADLIVLAVPEGAAVGAVRTLSGHLRADTLVVDTLSVKSRFHTALQQCARPPCQALGINPMFAPSLGIRGRPVAATIYRDGPLVPQFLRSLTEWGAKVVTLSAERHDRLVAATQALTHAAVLAFGMALSELDVSEDELFATAPPPHAVSLALLARVGHGVPEVYWDIQSGNPHARKARALLSSAVSSLSDVVEHGSESDFAELMRKASSPLGERAEYYQNLCASLFYRLSDDPTETTDD